MRAAEATDTDAAFDTDTDTEAAVETDLQIDTAYGAEAPEPTIAIEPVVAIPVTPAQSPAPGPTPSNDELAVVRNELTSALHEAHYQRRKRADAVQLLAYERLVRRSRVAGCLWLVLALALAAGGVWALIQSTELADVWQIAAASAGALTLICLVVAIVTWAGPARAQHSLSLRQVRKLAPPEMLSEAWFQAAHEVSTPLGYRKAFHGLV